MKWHVIFYALILGAVYQGGSCSDYFSIKLRVGQELLEVLCSNTVLLNLKLFQITRLTQH